MPSTIRFLTTIFWITAITVSTLYILATVFEPSSREYRHEVIGVTLEE